MEARRLGSSELVEVREAFVQLWSRMAPFWGVSPAAARAYAWLLARQGSADAEELMAGLGLSRGAVSMACRELVDWGLVRPAREGGSRRVLYGAEVDLEAAVRAIVLARKRREWDPILASLRQWIPRLETNRSPQAAAFRRRLEALESLVGFADSLAESFLKGGIVRAIGLKALVSVAGRAGRRRRSAGPRMKGDVP